MDRISSRLRKKKAMRKDYGNDGKGVSSMTKGYVQIYTGDGKGKTTAALGLALRSAGYKKRVFIGQFMKGQHYGELSVIAGIDGIDIEQFGDAGCIRKEEVTELHRQHGEKGIRRIEEILASGDYQMVIMDEIAVAIWFGIVDLERVLGVLQKRPDDVELILTGRRAPERLLAAADLVTEMKEIKHYYREGVPAREGIEF
jgi:cob(I)alamin adenosyltransferase